MNQQIIIYLKNEKEYTITSLEQLKQLEGINLKEGILFINNPNITKIHFKNINLKSKIKKICANKTKCILESSILNNIKLSGDYYEVINISNIDEVYFSELKELVITYNNNNYIPTYNKKPSIFLGLKDSNITIHDNNIIENLKLIAKNITLIGSFNETISLNLTADIITIGNKDITTEFKKLNKFYYPNQIKALEQLFLYNSNIDLKNNSDLKITTPLIEGENYYLSSEKGNIWVNNISFKNKNAIITNKEILRASLISLLKGTKEKINSSLEEGSKDYLPQNKELQKEINNKYKQIAILQKKLELELTKLAELEEQQLLENQTNKNKIKQELEKSSIKYLIKTKK